MFWKPLLYLDLPFLLKSRFGIFLEIKFSFGKNLFFTSLFSFFSSSFPQVPPFCLLFVLFFLAVFSLFVGSLFSLCVFSIFLHRLQILIFLSFSFLSLNCLNFSLVWVSFVFFFLLFFVLSFLSSSFVFLFSFYVLFC